MRDALRNWLHDEQGGAYTLSYVMVIPFVMLLVALIVETSLVLHAKLGTVYAGYAAARTASVHSSTSNDWNRVQQHALAAAQQAMLPFASATQRSSDGSASQDNVAQDTYDQAYREWAQEAVARGYVAAKFRDATSHLKISMERPTAWDAPLNVRVTYDYPFHVPGLGRLLGEESGTGGYTFPLSSDIVLHNDGPQNSTQTLGIGYGTRD